MYGKTNMETDITICKIDSQWELAVWLSKLKQGFCINLEGWDAGGHPKGDQSWVFMGGTDVEAETPILWPPDAKS